MRAFIGIKLPSELKEEIFQLTKSFPKTWDIKLVEKENLHLTLLFLGSISKENKEKIIKALTATNKPAMFKLTTKELKFFPKNNERRGIWLSIGEEREKLFSLYKKITDSALNLNTDFKKSSLRFSPHIALGRFRCQPSFVDLGELRADFWVNSFCLFERRSGKSGPVYIKIAEFKL